MDRPPLGVTPQEIWIELRKKDLARAIGAYIEIRDSEPVLKWIEELKDLVTRYP